MKNKQQSKIGKFVLIGQAEVLDISNDKTEGVFIYRSPAGRFKAYVFAGDGQFNAYSSVQSCAYNSARPVLDWFRGMNPCGKVSTAISYACEQAARVDGEFKKM